MPTAVMIGATGLVGSCLLRRLVADDRFTRVVSFGRRKCGLPAHPKLDEQVVDFDAPATWAAQVRGDIAFSALGTTLKAAGSQEKQRKIDYQYQLEFAQAAAKNGTTTYVLCSSSGADPGSRMFYPRIKGELDRDVQALGFERVRIMRPSLLGGDRGQNARLGEKVGSVMLGAFNALGIARKYREIPGDTVAQAMLSSAFDPAAGTRIFELDQVFTEAAASR